MSALLQPVENLTRRPGGLCPSPVPNVARLLDGSCLHRPSSLLCHPVWPSLYGAGRSRYPRLSPTSSTLLARLQWSRRPRLSCSRKTATIRHQLRLRRPTPLRRLRLPPSALPSTPRTPKTASFCSIGAPQESSTSQPAQGTHGDDRLSPSAIAGIAVGVGLAFVFIVAGLTWFLLRRRRRKQQEAVRSAGRLASKTSV